MRFADLAVSCRTLAVLTICLSQALWAQPQTVTAPHYGVYADMQAEAWSNGVPVMRLDGDWSQGYDRRDGTQRAYAQARAEFGASFWPSLSLSSSPWRLGLLARADASARLSGQAAQVLYHYQSRTDPAQPVVYNADTDIQFWTGQGLSLHAPLWQAGAFKLEVSWDHLRLRRLRSLQTAGMVGYNADRSYSYLGTLRDDDSRTHAVFSQAAEPQGVGDALSWALSWLPDAVQAWQPARLSFRMDDAWSRLSWGGINGNDAVLNSQVSTRTPDGYIEYNAAINGRYTRRQMVERIPVNTQLQADWAAGQGELSMQLKNRLGLWQRWLAWHSGGAVDWQAATEPVAHAWRLGAGWQGLNLSVMGDRLDDAAHARGVSLSWALAY